MILAYSRLGHQQILTEISNRFIVALALQETKHLLYLGLIIQLRLIYIQQRFELVRNHCWVLMFLINFNSLLKIAEHKRRVPIYVQLLDDTAFIFDISCVLPLLIVSVHPASHSQIVQQLSL